MLKHENPNITVISPDLWAVRFSLIPLIPQISITPEPGTDLTKERFVFANDGIIVLNKDSKIYPMLKKAFSAVMKLKPRQIEKELNLYAVGALKANNPKSMIYHSCLTLERERRKIKKGVKT